MRNTSNTKKADSIRSRMDTVRCDIDEDMHEIVGEVRSYFDWRACVRKSPLICLSAAFAAGYLMVPKKSLGRPTIPVQTFSPPDLPHSTSVNHKTHGTLLTFVSNLAVRGVTAYLENRVVKFAAAHAAKPTSEYRHEDSLCKPPEEPEPGETDSANRFSVHPLTR